ncbi:MAG TPA: hypothetical protein VHY57_11780 [Rhizomicrobium sp.]|nr:hypothetical protein [Rhizomicrobium sp.]
MHDFIVSYTAPSPASGRVARWHGGICPGVIGLPAAWNNTVEMRVRAVAALAGAPVLTKPCHANIDIVFTGHPQVLLDSVRDAKPFMLGYHDVPKEKELATVRHAVQAWYMTQTVDEHGGVFVDDKLRTKAGVTLISGNNRIDFPEAHVEYWNGSHLGDGRRSELIHVLVVADLVKVNGIELSAVADDIAMLSLAQTVSFEVCQPVASIVNLTAPGCASALQAHALSDSDLAYLRALYSVDPHDSLVQQQGKIALEMKKILGASSESPASSPRPATSACDATPNAPCR